MENVKPIYISFSEQRFKTKPPSFRKGELLISGRGDKYRIVKVFKPTWWRKALKKLGLGVRMNQVQVRVIKLSEDKEIP